MGTIAGFAMVQPVSPRPRLSDASGLTGAWFEASVGNHTLRLYAGGAPRHAADAAVALNRCEALLDGLDEWLGTALDWRWIATPASVTATATHARVHWRPVDAMKGKKGVACRVEMPWSLLRMLPAPDEALAARLQWPEVPVVLALAQLSIPRGELADLEPGGALVMPASMQPCWQGVLRSLDEPCAPGAGLPISLASPWAPRRIPLAERADARTQVSDGVLCEVRMAAPNVVAGDRLAGWYEGDIGAAGGQAALWRCATDREPAVCLATGELMPWGDGWALALQQVSEIRQELR